MQAVALHVWPLVRVLLCRLRMRTLALVSLLIATGAFASGTIVNTEPDVPVSEIKIRPSPQTRLVEIDRELRDLTHRTPATAVFSMKMGSMAPWLTVAAIPLMVVGGVLGIFGQGSFNNTKPDFILIPAGVVAGIAALAGIVATFVSLLAVFDHWAQEAASSGDRHERERTLRTERQELLLRL